MAGNFSLLQHPLYVRHYSRSKLQCFRNVISKPPPDDAGLYCPPRHDHFLGCWNYTEAGTRAYLPCPNIPGFAPEKLAYFDCLGNGSWFVHPATGKEYADYMGCRNYHNVIKETEKDIAHVYVSIAGFSVSFLLIVCSLVIFFKFRQLRCDRITIHKNLFISYAMTDLLNIGYLSVLGFNDRILIENPVWCQVLHVITQYTIVCNFAWMFCEGLYLHTLLINTFISGNVVITACFIIGWFVPLGLTVVYSSIRAILSIDTQFCWLYESSLQWILFAPVVLSMLINVLFVINVVRLLVTKLRQGPQTAQTRKAVRAMAILIPLVGLQFLVFIKRPNDRDSTLYDVYTYAVAIVISLQGSFVSVIYCFCNGEVLALLRRRWDQRRVMLLREQKHAHSAPTSSTTYTFMDHMSLTHAP